MKLRNRLLPGGRKKEFEDLGFGTKITDSVDRLINQNGSFNIERRGAWAWTPYQSLVEMSWSQFLLLILVFYVSVNLFFAALHLLAGVEHISGIASGHWLEDLGGAFFFSVQTFTTVGYGAMSPIGFLSNVIAAFCALVGLISFALATGLVYARFSKPKAQILFSRKALIAPYNDGKSFQFRIVNRRSNKIINLTAKVTMTWVEHDRQGTRRRRFAGLPLERDQVFMFPLNWTLVHPIGSDSPFYDLSQKDLEVRHVEVIVLIEGYDETFAQTVHASSSYTWEEIFWNTRFKPMYFDDRDGKTVLELDRIDEVE